MLIFRLRSLARSGRSWMVADADQPGSDTAIAGRSPTGGRFVSVTGVTRLSSLHGSALLRIAEEAVCAHKECNEVSSAVRSSRVTMSPSFVCGAFIARVIGPDDDLP